MKKFYTMEEILVENSTYKNRSFLKERLIKEELLENKCELCGNDGNHNGLPLVLQLDHINGENTDNRIDNLRFLCPNCHSQTETFSGKQNKKHRGVKNCIDCGSEIERRAERCRSCSQTNAHKHLISDRIPLKEDLLNDIMSMTFNEVGKKHDVTASTIKRWCKRVGIPHRKKDLTNLEHRSEF